MLKLGIITYKCVQRTYSIEEKSQNHKHKCTFLIFRNKKSPKNWLWALILFSVDHLLVAMQLTLHISLLHSLGGNLIFIYNVYSYCLSIGNSLGMGVCVHFSFPLGTPSAADPMWALYRCSVPVCRS